MANEYETSRAAGGRFGPGNPGRPLGAQNRVSRRAADAILDDFEVHRDTILTRLRETNAPAYMRAVSGLLPRETAAVSARPEPDAWSEEDRKATYAEACRLCRNELDETLGLRDLVEMLWRPRSLIQEP